MALKPRLPSRSRPAPAPKNKAREETQPRLRDKLAGAAIKFGSDQFRKTFPGLSGLIDAVASPRVKDQERAIAKAEETASAVQQENVESIDGTRRVVAANNRLLQEIIDAMKQGGGGLPGGGGRRPPPRRIPPGRGKYGNRARQRLQRMQNARRTRAFERAGARAGKAYSRVRTAAVTARTAVSRGAGRVTTAIRDTAARIRAPSPAPTRPRIEPRLAPAAPAQPTTRVPAGTPTQPGRINVAGGLYYDVGTKRFHDPNLPGNRNIVSGQVAAERGAVRPSEAQIAESERARAASRAQPQHSAPAATPEPRPAVSRTPSTAEPASAMREERTVVNGRSVTFNATAYNRTVSAVRFGGGAATILMAMGIYREVSRLWALRELNKENPNDGITEEEFFEALMVLASGVLAGAAGAALGAKIGGLLGGLTGGPWGALAGGIAGGIFVGMQTAQAAELIAAAILDQITGSNRFNRLWESIVTEAQRQRNAPASELAAEPITQEEATVAELQTTEEQRRRAAAGITERYANAELERRVLDLQEARARLARSPTPVNRNSVNSQETGLRNFIASQSSRLSREDIERANRALETRPARVQPNEGLVTRTSAEMATPVSDATKTDIEASMDKERLVDLIGSTRFDEIVFDADELTFEGSVLNVLNRAVRDAADVSPTSSATPDQAPAVTPAPAPTPPGAAPSSMPSAAPGTALPSQLTGVPPAVSPGLAIPTAAPAATPIPGGTSIPGGSPETPSNETPISRIVQAAPGFNVVEYSDGRMERRSGARNWRNNNPGNIEFGDFARRFGAIGSDGRFAIFPTYAAGRAAKAALIFEGRNYRDLSIAQAITRYAPPSENNTANYINTVVAAAGVPASTPMNSLNAAQRQAVLAAMERIEGFRVGRVEVLRQGTGSSMTAGAPTPVPAAAGQDLAQAGTNMVAGDQRLAASVQQGPAASGGSQAPTAMSAQAQQAPSQASGEVPLNRRLMIQAQAA